MSYPTTNDAVSPQVTGVTNATGTFQHDSSNPSYLAPSDQQHSNGIEAAPVSPAPAYNEKVEHANADAQYPMATPQQEYANTEKSSYAQASQENTNTPKSQYQNAYATPLGNLQGAAAPVDCPVCHKREMTRTEFVSGGTTHGMAALLCCCLCLGCIPYMANWFKDCEHKCGNCGALLAVWHRSGRTDVVAHSRAA